MAGTSFGRTPVGMTPAVTPAGSTADSSERNAEFQEHEKILSADFLSLAQITDLLEEDIAGVEEKLQIFLNFKNIQTSLKDAILLDYYVSGFLWAKEMNFSVDQYSKFMTLLYTILQNLQMLHMSLEDSIEWLGKVMAEIGPNHLGKHEDGHIFNIRQANAIVDYLKTSLFQHYRLYEFLFHATREEIVIGTEQTIEVVKPPNYPFPAPLEEGLSMDIYSTFIAPQPDLDVEAQFLSQEQSSPEAQPETDTADVDPLVGFTIEDVKTALAHVTDEVLVNVQTEITEKLQIQEEAFNARIEKLKKT